MTFVETIDETRTSIKRLSRDLRSAAEHLSDAEARFLVDAYYQMQDSRIAMGNASIAMDKSQEPNGVLTYLWDQHAVLENQIKAALDRYTRGHPLAAWARSNKGIGPVLASALLAHIDIARAPTAGHIWSFAGLSPGKVLEKGQKRPWNAELKKRCFLMGESFVKTSGGDDQETRASHEEG